MKVAVLTGGVGGAKLELRTGGDFPPCRVRRLLECC